MGMMIQIKSCLLSIVLTGTFLFTPVAAQAEVRCLDCCGHAYQDSFQCCMLGPAIGIGAVVIGGTIALLFINRTSSHHAHSATE